MCATTPPESLPDLVTPAEWAKHHGRSLGHTYRLLKARRLPFLNVSAGSVRPLYLLDLTALPEQQPRELPLVSGVAESAAGPAS